jgi:DNA polymerase IV (DinB-like DNA polymerase)
MLVDLDYFFAQAEETRNPAIRDKPVVVCVYSGRSEESGAVSTSNYLARKYGVKSGMPIFLAKKKLENVEAVFLPVDHDFYDDTSLKVMDVLRRHADSFEQVGIDEAFLDVTRKAGADFEKARRLAEEIKGDIQAKLRLTCSIGIGPNKLVAKVAADSQKPDGLTIVKPECVQSFLFPLPIDRLIGVGVKTKEKMQSLGIGTIGELAKYDAKKLIDVFGKSLGKYFHQAALGLDDEPVAEKGEVESVSRISTLKQDTRDMSLILQKTDQLCDEIHSTIQVQKLSFKAVAVIVITKDMAVHTRSKTLENPASDKEIMKQTVKDLLVRLLGETQMEMRRVGVRVANFAKEQDTQKQLTSFIEPAKND